MSDRSDARQGLERALRFLELYPGPTPECLGGATADVRRERIRAVGLQVRLLALDVLDRAGFATREWIDRKRHREVLLQPAPDLMFDVAARLALHEAVKAALANIDWLPAPLQITEIRADGSLINMPPSRDRGQPNRGPRKRKPKNPGGSVAAQTLDGDDDHGRDPITSGGAAGGAGGADHDAGERPRPAAGDDRPAGPVAADDDRGAGRERSRDPDDNQRDADAGGHHPAAADGVRAGAGEVG